MMGKRWGRGLLLMLGCVAVFANSLGSLCADDLQDDARAVDGQILGGEPIVGFPQGEVGPRESVGVGDLPHSILFPRTNVSVKVGGYAKADFIHDFNAIGNTDFFDTTTIPTSGPQTQNTRLHARQTRLNLDVLVLLAVARPLVGRRVPSLTRINQATRA